MPPDPLVVPASRPPATPAAPRPAVPETDDDVTLLELANVLLRHWRTVIAWPVALVLVTAVASLVVRPIYTATTAFVPEKAAGPRFSGLAELAGQLGVTLGGGDAGSSPRFYADLIRSPRLMEQVLRGRYPDPRPAAAPGDSADLLTILQVRGGTLPDSLQNGSERLGKRISIRVDNATGIVRLSIDSPYPVVAAEVANRFIHHLNEFNANTRQTQARQRRRFGEERVQEAQRELRQAEDELAAFYERNRSWQRAPQLMSQESRLRREVDLRQEVYATLQREYEIARIDEVNDAPVVTVIHEATPPRKRSWPRRSVMVAAALAVGLVMGVFAAFVRDYGDRQRQQHNRDYVEFRELLSRIRAELLGLIGRRPRS